MSKSCKGKCPKCGSDNLEYGSTVLDGESFGYKFECKDCNCQGTEWYNLEYVETIDNDEND